MDYVASILGESVQVVYSSPAVQKALVSAGAIHVEGRVELKFKSKQQLASALQTLQQLGILFVDEPAGWPPAAVFQQLREEGLVFGTIGAISWRAPDAPVVRRV
jgi:hypothetical protein